MALLLCPDCGKKYSSSLDACPECHSPAAGASEVPSSPDSAAGRRELRDFDLSGATRKGWLEGMIFKGKYELVRKLGQGAQTEAWQAKDLEASDDGHAVHVALKLLPQDVSDSRVELARIKSNFQKVRELIHQRIAAYLAFEQDAGGCMVVMELAPGLTLGEYRLEHVNKHGDFPLSEVLRICRQIAEGLDYAHSRQVAHRDIKPDNIMVTPEGNVKILDFGLASEIRSSLSRVSKRETSDTSGTNQYKAPEQWRGLPPQNSTDQYALAAVFYELLSGFPPFSSDDSGILRACVLNDSPQPLPMLSEAQNRALAKALAKEPSERFATCTAFIDALTEEPEALAPAAADPVPGSAPAQAPVSLPEPARIPERGAKKTKRGRGWFVLVLLACVFLYREFSGSKGNSEREAGVQQTVQPEAPQPPAEPARQTNEEEMQAWVDAQPIKLGEKLARDFIGEDYLGSGSSLMSFAAVQGKTDVMEWLKAKGEDVNAKDYFNTTPMHVAAGSGHVAAMDWLKANGADVNAKNNGGMTPIHSAAYLGEVSALEWFKENGADIHAKDDVGETLMHKAANLGRVSAMKWLKENGADVNADDGRRKAPIYNAAMGGHVAAMEWLKANGADVNTNSYFGRTPMHEAAQGGHVAALKWLKENGGDVNSKDMDYATPTHSAVWGGHISNGSNIAALEWLKANGADVNAKDGYGDTPLDKAAALGYVAVQEWLKANGGKRGSEL